MFENSTVCHIVDELITRPMSISLGLVGLVPLVVIDNSDNFVSDRFLPGSLFPRLAFWLVVVLFFNGEFDPGSGRTLAACLTHASRAVNRASARGSAANGCVTRGQPAPDSGIPPG